MSFLEAQSVARSNSTSAEAGVCERFANAGNCDCDVNPSPGAWSVLRSPTGAAWREYARVGFGSRIGDTGNASIDFGDESSATLTCFRLRSGRAVHGTSAAARVNDRPGGTAGPVSSNPRLVMNCYRFRSSQPETQQPRLVACNN